MRVDDFCLSHPPLLLRLSLVVLYHLPPFLPFSYFPFVLLVLFSVLLFLSSRVLFLSPPSLTSTRLAFSHLDRAIPSILIILIILPILPNRFRIHPSHTLDILPRIWWFAQHFERIYLCASLQTKLHYYHPLHFLFFCSLPLCHSHSVCMHIYRLLMALRGQIKSKLVTQLH